MKLLKERYLLMMKMNKKKVKDLKMIIKEMEVLQVATIQHYKTIRRHEKQKMNTVMSTLHLAFDQKVNKVL